MSSNSPLFEQALHYQQAGEVPAAIAHYQTLIAQAPSADLYANLGVALRTQGHLEAAVAAYQRALALNPEHLPALSNLGGALRALGRLDPAQRILQTALTLNPEFAAAQYNLGLSYMDHCQPAAALPCFEAAFALEPHRVDAPFDRAVCLLQQGDWSAGFPAYECRFAFEPRLVKPYKQPKWDGSPLQGKTLLLCAEQGFGDTLQFIRYLPLIAKDRGRIILECPAPLKPLMALLPDLDGVVSPGDPVPAFDTYAFLLSLPALFQTTVDTVPPSIRYPLSELPYKPLPSLLGTRLKVGLVWGSGHTDVGVRNRSIEFKQFMPLLSLSDIAFYSLQVGPQAQQLKACGAEALVKDLSFGLSHFADTAAVLRELDCLITADTAIVHLAGSLELPTWVLLPYASEWRWLLERTDTPWYPSVRLFRQAVHGDWEKVFQEVQHCLKQYERVSNNLPSP